MKKIISFILVGILSILLSSCLKVDTEINIDKNLGVVKKQVQDFKQINDITRNQIEQLKESAKSDTGTIITEYDDKVVVTTKSQYGESTQTIEKPKKPCENYKEEDLQKDKEALNFKSYTCKNLDEDKALLTFYGGSIKEYVEKSNGKYVLKLNNLNGENKSKKQTKEERKQVADMYRGYGVEMDFVINLPGKIEKTDAGKIEGNKLTFSIYDLLESESDDPEVVFVIDPKSKVSNNTLTRQSTPINLNLESKGLSYKYMILAKKRLEKSVKGRKYVKKIDEIVDKYSNKPKALKKLYAKLDKIDLENRKYRKIKDVVIYLKYKTAIAIYKSN